MRVTRHLQMKGVRAVGMPQSFGQEVRAAGGSVTGQTHTEIVDDRGCAPASWWLDGLLSGAWDRAVVAEGGSMGRAVGREQCFVAALRLRLGVSEDVQPMPAVDHWCGARTDEERCEGGVVVTCIDAASVNPTFQVKGEGAHVRIESEEHV